MCRHGKLNTLEWYDKPLPDLTVTLCGIRSLKLPQDEAERSRLTFDTFPWEIKLVFHLEASDEAWYRLKPLLSLMVEQISSLRHLDHLHTYWMHRDLR